MDQDGVIRTDAPHNVSIPEGGGVASAVRPVREFGAESREVSSGRRLRLPKQAGVQWAEFEGALPVQTQDGWAVRPARITHMGKPPASRTDFRGKLKQLRSNNAGVRNRLNQLMAPVRQVMK